MEGIFGWKASPVRAAPSILCCLKRKYPTRKVYQSTTERRRTIHLPGAKRFSTGIHIINADVELELFFKPRFGRGSVFPVRDRHCPISNSYEENIDYRRRRKHCL